MRLFSRRNRVYLVTRGSSARVEKKFLLRSDWERELSLYRALEGRIAVPRLYETEDCLLVTEYLFFPTLLDTLETQERGGFRAEPWFALSTWLKQCHTCCGMVPGDRNLRNFLWDESGNVCVGLDFEEYRKGSVPEAGAVLIAYLLEYDSADTPVKASAAAILREELGVPKDEIDRTRLVLRSRRSSAGMRKTV